MRFDGANGKKPSGQARRYVYARLANMLLEDIRSDTSLVLKHLDDKIDKRRALNEAKKVITELHRKANRAT